LNAEAEIRDIFGHLKSLIMINEEMGLEPPPIPTEALNYLEVGISGGQDKTKGVDNLSSLEALRAFIGECQRCKLHKGRTHLVFGEGSSNAKLVFVGEGPGRDEDMVGKPFVGEAGKLLTKIIEKGMGLNREDVYICNVVKCRPPSNRDPERDEIETCIPFLKQQLSIIKPEAICILGRIAGQALLGGDFKITLKRGQWHSYMDIPAMPTFHPAYILRNPSRERELKGQVWEDIKKIMKHLGLEVKKNG
jgi:uracil-DNA glycosylase family 4